MAVTARGSAATPVAGAAEASPPAAADAIADAALPVVSARATVAPATATADAAPPATSAAAIPVTAALAPAAAAAEAELRPPEAAEGEAAPSAAAAAEPTPPAAAEAKPRQSAAAAAAAEESPPATKAAACDAPCGIEPPANEAGPPGLGSKLQLQLNHAALAKAVKKENCLQGGLRLVKLPAAAVAATSAAAGRRASMGMKSRRVPTAAVPIGADTMTSPELGVVTVTVGQVEAAGTRVEKQHGINEQPRAKVGLSKNSSRDAAGNGLGGDGGEGNGGVSLPNPSNAAAEPLLRAAGLHAVHNGSSGERGMRAPRGMQRLVSIAAGVKAEPPAVGPSPASVPATAAAQEPHLPPTAGLDVAAAAGVSLLPVVRGGDSPMPAPAAVVAECEALTAGRSLLPHAAAGVVAQQVKSEQLAPQADDAAAMGAAAGAASAPSPMNIAITTAAGGGQISAIGRTAAGAEGFIAAIEGAAATAATANGARMPAAIAVQSSAGTQTAATATTAAARRARSLDSVPMHAATAAEVIVIDDSDDESAELAAGVLMAGKGGAVFQQRSKLMEMAGVNREPDTEVGNALAAATSAAAAAVEVCRVRAAILGEGLPAAPTLEAVEAQAAPAAAGVQMASNQQLLGALLPGLNPREAMGEGVLDIAASGAPVEVTAAAGAGASSGDVTLTASANPLAGLDNSAQEILDTAAARSSGSIPLGAGISGGEQGGHATPNVQTDAAADCSADRGAATPLLVGPSLQGMAGCAGGAAVGSLTATGAVAPNPFSSAGAAGIEQLRPDHSRSQPAAAAHPLASAAPAIAAAATAAGASSVEVAAGTGEGNPNQVAAAGAEQHQLKYTSSVQDYGLKDTGNVAQAALEVMQLCEKLKVSMGWSNMV